MKKFEKVFLGIFMSGIIAFIADFVFEVIASGVEPDYHFFSGITRLLSILSIISFFGLMVLLVNIRLRKRVEVGKPPVSKLYKISFIFSFIPFLLLVIYSALKNEFVFMGTTVAVGAEAVLDNLIIVGVYIFSIVIPLFPVVIFWQILYIIKRIQYGKLMKANNELCRYWCSRQPANNYVVPKWEK